METPLKRAFTEYETEFPGPIKSHLIVYVIFLFGENKKCTQSS